uniref:Uracil-DNA glycosylase-like domain-containing protein n=1 Tax=viral metagenome TaxID=1070528 RepID=A0A6C0LW21_9ZZZZ
MLHTQIKLLNTDWKNYLIKYSDLLNNINENIENEYNIFGKSISIFPPKDKIFNTFNHFDIKDLKVVFIGQDCYHRKGQANGLCFSVPNDIKTPPSLRNIFKELYNDIGITRTNTEFNDLAKQGILFLNTSLTVREKCPESHIKFWLPYTTEILKDISNHCDKVIFVLWGNYAKGKKKYIDTNKHHILEAKHPSPLSANRGGFFGCKHFSKINKKLIEWDKNPIKWI